MTPLAHNGVRNQILFIVPQDLIPRCYQDISQKLGIEARHVATPAQARRIAHHLRAGGITRYEALSLLGAKNELLPVTELCARGSGWAPQNSAPACQASHHGGWQHHSPLVCSVRHTDEITGGEAAAATSTSVV